MKITKKQSVLFVLLHQRLLPPRNLEGKEGILEYIKSAGCIQFDPLDMAGNNPNLVLQSRIKGFRQEYLRELLYTDRKLLDGWDKNMSIYSLEDWPYFKRYREEARKRYGGKSKPINKILGEVREEIEVRGPLSSIDLKYDNKVDWAWAPTRAARAALESMYLWGELIIHHKDRTRKVYDFAQKHLPHEILSNPDPNSSITDYIDWHVKRRIGAIGMLWNRPSDAWLGIHWMKSRERAEAFSRLEQRREILPIEVEDIEFPLYILKEDEELLDAALQGMCIVPEASFIAPLDNLLWDRKLIRQIFGFEYTWEVYKPVLERKYGYYVLPVLYGDIFIARFEPKFIKKESRLEIINWWWEPEIIPTEEMKKALARCFKDFLDYLGCNCIQLNNTADSRDLEWLMKSIE